MSIIRRSSDGDQKVVAYYSKHIDQRKTTYEPEMISYLCCLSKLENDQENVKDNLIYLVTKRSAYKPAMIL